jgi:V8-like Glu-specific endopeptidase
MKCVVIAALLLLGASHSLSAAPIAREQMTTAATEQGQEEVQALRVAPQLVGGISSKKLLFYSRLWPLHSRIKVAFDGTHPDLYPRIAQLAGLWTDQTTIRFDFVSPTGEFYRWSPQDKVHQYPVRVGFADGAFYSYVGTQCASAPPSQKTVSFPSAASIGDDAFWDASVLHEFGHVLGLPHAFNHPNAEVDFDKETLRSRFPGSAFELLFQSTDASWTPLRPSPVSVMNYAFDASTFLAKERSPWFQERMQASLSDYDRQLVHLVYGEDAERPTEGAILLREEANASDTRPEPNYELQTHEIYRLVDPSVIFKLAVATGYVCKIVAAEDFRHPRNMRDLRPNDSIGTGFLVSNSLVLTCDHVVPEGVASKVYVDFEYARSRSAMEATKQPIGQFSVDKIVNHSSTGDWTLLRIKPVGEILPGTQFTYYPLAQSQVENVTLFQDPLRVIVVQYPGDARLQLAINEEAKLVEDGVPEPQLRYDADTEGGSSGSPVFSLFGRVIGIHRQAGPPKKKKPAPATAPMTAETSIALGIKPRVEYNIGRPINLILNEMRSECDDSVLAELGITKQ